MKINPTPLTAALTGVFSSIVWPILWTRLGSATSSGSVELVFATLLVIALPAHAFVVGFSPSQPTGARALDTPLLKRIGAWLGAALATLAVVAAIRS